MRLQYTHVKQATHDYTASLETGCECKLREQTNELAMFGNLSIIYLHMLRTLCMYIQCILKSMGTRSLVYAKAHSFTSNPYPGDDDDESYAQLVEVGKLPVCECVSECCESSSHNRNDEYVCFICNYEYKKTFHFNFDCNSFDG